MSAGTCSLRAALLVGACVGAAACSSAPVTSRVVRPGDAAVGVPYGLPSTVLVLNATVTPDEGDGSSLGTSTLTLAARRVADPTVHLVLEHSPAAFSDDDVDVELAGSGLLKGVALTSEDKTAEVVSDVLATAIAAVKLGVRARTPSGPTSLELDLETTTRQIAAAMRRSLADVSGPVEHAVPLGDVLVGTGRPRRVASAAVTDGTRRSELFLTVSRRPAGEPACRDDTGQPAPCRPGRAEAAGVFVRRPEAHILDVELEWRFEWDWKAARTLLTEPDSLRLAAERLGLDVDATDGTLSTSRRLASLSTVVEAPDFGPVVLVPLERARFVKAQADLDFTGGALTGYHVTRPSTAAAASKIPLNAVETAFDAVGELATLRVNMATERRAAEDQRLQDMLAANQATQAAIAARKSWRAAVDAGLDDVVVHERRTAYLSARIKANFLSQRAGLPEPFPTID